MLGLSTCNNVVTSNGSPAEVNPGQLGLGSSWPESTQPRRQDRLVGTMYVGVWIDWGYVSKYK